MRFLITGTNGQVATALRERAAASGIAVAFIGRPHVNFRDPATVETAVAGTDADVVVNAAAYTAVDKAEEEEAVAHAVNAAAAGAVARGAARRGIPVIHLSTDYVFDGRADRPYREDDTPAPLGAYARSKLAGEQAVMRGNPRHAILRTSWVFSPFGQNFVQTMLRLGETRQSVRVVADQHGAPTSAHDVADAIIAVGRNMTGRPQDGSLNGVFHVASAGETVFARFAETIFAQAQAHGRAPVTVEHITAADYGAPAPRPANSRLDTGKIARVHGVVLPAWEDALRLCVARILGAPQARAR